MKRGVKDSKLKGAEAQFATEGILDFFGANPRKKKFYTFLRISQRKVNILKRAKMCLTELNEVYGMKKK